MISIVIPIQNESANLPQLARSLASESQSWDDEYEIILVDDGSTDASPQIMRELADRDPHFRIVTLSRNFGHQAAISAGLKYARGDAVIVMDGDLQDPTQDLQRFLTKWREGYDVVYAVRTKRKEGAAKRLAYKFFYRAINLVSDIDIPLDAGDFCLMDRRVRDALVLEMPEQNRFVRGLRAYAGFNQTGIPSERGARAAGEAKYTFAKLFHLGLDGVMDFSLFPLRLAAYLGFAVAIPSFLAGILLIFRQPSGLALLSAGLFFLGGVTLIALGILGEYIGRIYNEVKRRPTYLVASVYSQNDATTLPKAK